jgi:pimeloyl-ACP methyl ester carboxylesterase
MFDGLDTHDLRHDGVRLRVRSAGQGPPLLPLHGHPQTHAMWHAVAPRLTQRFTVIAMAMRSACGAPFASQFSGRAVDCGHYIAEEQPGALLDDLQQFLGERA